MEVRPPIPPQVRSGAGLSGCDRGRTRRVLMRVLVVEDDLEAQRYLCKGLKEAGHVVDEAGDGEIGLTLALSRPYDVAIVDRMLPKLDGLRLVAGMRGERNMTPVLFLSALSDVDDRIKGLRAGGDDYLT